MRRGAPVWISILVLSLAFLVALLPETPASAHPSTFSDVPATGPVHEAVSYLSSAGVLGGYADGTFGPGRTVTRGQAAKILVLDRGISVPASLSGRFVDGESVYGRYAEAAAARGWIGGYPDGTFRPYEGLQRQHMAVIVVRSLGWDAQAQALTAAQRAAALALFSDAGRIQAAAAPYVALAVSRGLFQGTTGGRLEPAATISRAQFALVAYRADLTTVAVVQGIRFSADYPDKTRVVYDLSRQPGTPRVDPSQPGRLLIDLPEAVARGDGLIVHPGSPEVSGASARQQSHRPAVARLTLDLGRYSRFAVDVLPPSEGRGHRLVVDVFRRVPGPNEGPPLVVLDAGHGGADPGAIGVTGLREKDVNLGMTLAADQYLRQAGLRTLLTRDDDSLPTLAERADLANAAQADIFVSIHNNAAADPKADGTYTFYWGYAGGEYSVEGKRLAETIQRHVVARLGSVDRGARTHWVNLYVLDNTEMPACLVEGGFLTNPEEEAKLRDPAYQRLAARGIAEGVMAYLGWSFSFAE